MQSGLPNQPKSGIVRFARKRARRRFADPERLTLFSNVTRIHIVLQRYCPSQVDHFLVSLVCTKREPYTKCGSATVHTALCSRTCSRAVQRTTRFTIATMIHVKWYTTWAAKSVY